MTNERKQHLELIAASLTQSYYLVHTSGSRDHRELLETYDFFLEALVEKDTMPRGHLPLQSSDTLANHITDDSRD